MGFPRTESYDGSFEVQVCYFVWIEGSVYYSEGTGASQLEFEDIDGDGLADHVLKRDGDSAVRARRNTIGKANLLWRVHRPLGGSVEIDYRREGNLVVPSEAAAGDAPVDESGLPVDDAHTEVDDRTAVVDMPSSQWVLSDVVVRDGVEGVSGAQGVHTYRTRIDTYGDGIYHRDERVDLGYRRVTTTMLGDDAVSAMSVEEVEYRNEDVYRRGLVARSTLRDGEGMLYTVEEVDHLPPDLGQIEDSGCSSRGRRSVGARSTRGPRTTRRRFTRARGRRGSSTTSGTSATCLFTARRERRRTTCTTTSSTSRTTLLIS
ncbi:toxin TcdB middle/N-terminal domain-containing protein [Sorangium sp. So ce1128]